MSLAITATGFGKMLTVWLGGEFSDRIGRKKMAIAGGILYIICFAGLLFTSNFMVACVSAFLAGVATSGFWDASSIRQRRNPFSKDMPDLLLSELNFSYLCPVLFTRFWQFSFLQQELADQYLDSACHVDHCSSACSDCAVCL